MQRERQVSTRTHKEQRWQPFKRSCCGELYIGQQTPEIFYRGPDRQFMHLGFHIYDVGFQSPNVEAARPLVYATALLLIVIIIVLNLAAIKIRNRLRENYKASES